MIAGGSDGVIRLISTTDSRLIRAIESRGSSITDMDLSPGRTHVMVCDKEQVSRIFRLEDGAYTELPLNPPGKRFCGKWISETQVVLGRGSRMPVIDVGLKAALERFNRWNQMLN